MKSIIQTKIIALINRCHWQIGLFTKWMKGDFGDLNQITELSEGVANGSTRNERSLMLQLLTGTRLGKQAIKLIRFNLMGHAILKRSCHFCRWKTAV